MRALITRPSEDSTVLRQELRRRGFDVTIEPMLTIENISGAAIDAEGAQAIMFTSSNGVRAFARNNATRNLPAYAVGDATARVCGDEGFSDVHSAAGDVDDLANLVIRECRPAAGRLIHVAGSVRAGDLAGALQAAGFDVIRAPLYDASPATALSEGLILAMKRRQIDIALFFSPRTASTFVSLARAAGLEDASKATTAICLSPAVARRAGALPWHKMVVAGEPTQTALLAALDAQGK